MSTTQVFDVVFEIVKLNPAGQAGNAYAYRRGQRRANVAAASIHPRDLLAVLNLDIPMSAGEVIEVIHARPFAGTGTEGQAVLS